MMKPSVREKWALLISLAFYLLKTEQKRHHKINRCISHTGGWCVLPGTHVQGDPDLILF